MSINYKKLIKIIALAFVLLLVAIILVIAVAMWPSQPLKESLKKNYEIHKEEITDLKHYFESITDNGKIKVSIEYKWNGIDHLCANGDCFHSSDENKDSLNKIISELGWNNETIKTLRKKLKAANCISISNNILRQGLQVGFKRRGMGMYFYVVFDKDLTEEEIKKFSNDCDFIYYKNNIVLEYGGGVIGPQCFED
ncbi:MAG: hypothetical protein K0R25_1277 [Rickettsiaceae bacterium]|jgi:hypothetical protein|nr:hypothetical protein [Rickettsiaceae bacterium]